MTAPADCFECGHDVARHEALAGSRRGLCDARRCDCIEWESPLGHSPTPDASDDSPASGGSDD